LPLCRRALKSAFCQIFVCKPYGITRWVIALELTANTLLHEADFPKSIRLCLCKTCTSMSEGSWLSRLLLICLARHLLCFVLDCISVILMICFDSVDGLQGRGECSSAYSNRSTSQAGQFEHVVQHRTAVSLRPIVVHYYDAGQAEMVVHTSCHQRI